MAGHQLLDAGLSDGGPYDALLMPLTLAAVEALAGPGRTRMSYRAARAVWAAAADQALADGLALHSSGEARSAYARWSPAAVGRLASDPDPAFLWASGWARLSNDAVVTLCDPFERPAMPARVDQHMAGAACG